MKTNTVKRALREGKVQLGTNFAQLRSQDVARILAAQDEWKIRPNLTMNYGLRYEFYSVLREARNRNVMFDTVNGGILPPDTPFYKSARTNFGPRLAFSWSPERFNNKTVFRIGAGYYYGPGQTEDLIQPIESDRVSRTITGAVYPIDPAAIIAGYNINDPNLGYQPRAYAPGYKVPERISYTASIQQQLPGETVLTVAYVGSQGRNLFLRSWTNQITGVATDPVTGRSSASNKGHRAFWRSLTRNVCNGKYCWTTRRRGMIFRCPWLGLSRQWGGHCDAPIARSIHPSGVGEILVKRSFPYIRGVLFSVGLGVAALESGCDGTPNDVSASKTPAAAPSSGLVTLSAEESSRAGLVVESVIRSDFRTYRDFPGIVQPDQHNMAEITTLVRGRVVDVYADLGQEVKANTPLAILYSSELGLAQSGYLKARAKLNLAEQSSMPGPNSFWRKK